MTFPSSPTCPIVHWTASHTCQAEPRPTSNDPPPSHGRCCESPSAGGLTWQVGHARSQLAGHNESAPESTHAPWRRSRYTSWRRVRVTCQLSNCSCGTTGTATIRCPTHSSGQFLPNSSQLRDPPLGGASPCYLANADQPAYRVPAICPSCGYQCYHHS